MHSSVVSDLLVTDVFIDLVVLYCLTCTVNHMTHLPSAAYTTSSYYNGLMNRLFVIPL